MIQYLPAAGDVIAVVAGQSWLRWATRLGSALLPHVSYEVLPRRNATALDAG